MDNTGNVREYVGARYVPLFADPMQWDKTKDYEPLTIVLYQGNSYTSRQYVPVGIEITNNDFWAETGNYNAQVEAYRQEVLNYLEKINNNTTAIQNNATAIQNNATAIQNNTTAIQNNTTAIQNEATERNVADNKLSERIEKLEEKPYALYLGDSWVNPSWSGWADWVTPCSSKLGCETLNYGDGGARFITTETTTSESILAQANKATIEHADDNIKYIIIVGGTNDLANTQYNTDSYVNGIKSVVNKVQSTWPSANIIVFQNNALNNGTDANKRRVVNLAKNLQPIKNLLALNGINYNTDLVFGMCSETFYQNDVIHPSTTAIPYMSSCIAGNMQSNFTFLKRYNFTNTCNFIITMNTYGVTLLAYNINLTGGTSDVTLDFSESSNVSASTRTIFNYIAEISQLTTTVVTVFTTAGVTNATAKLGSNNIVIGQIKTALPNNYFEHVWLY